MGLIYLKLMNTDLAHKNFGLYLYGIFPDTIPETLEIKGLDGKSVHSQVVDGFTFLSEVLNVKKSLIKIAQNMLNFGRRIKIF